MNFLAHFFFDGRLNAPYFNMGLVLPDLMGISERGWKIHHLPKDDNLSPETKALKEGIEHHHQMDHFFHNSHFFRDSTEQIKTRFRQNSLDFPDHRLFFVAHIFLELMMDRIIVKADAQTAHHFYQELSQVRYSKLTAFFEEASVKANNHFPKFLGRFLEYRYALNYPDDQSLVYSLNRIFERVGHPGFEGAGILKRLNSVIFEVEKYLETQWNTLEHEMKSFKPHGQ